MKEYVKDKVSIIIPCYNCSKTIEKTLKSLERQTYKDFEAIIVDDGSTDETSIIVDRYISKEPFHISVVHQKNAGVSTARNRGLDIADGEYVAFLDADDMYHPEFLERLILSIKIKRTDVSYCFLTRKAEIWDVESPRNNKIDFKKRTVAQLTNIVINEKYRLGFYTFLYRNKIIQDNNIRFTIGLKTGEDLEFLWTYICYCRTCTEVNKYLYWYYSNPISAVTKVEWYRTESLSSIERVSKLMHKTGFEMADKFRDYMKARYIWSYAKTFSVGKRKDLYLRLSREFPVKQSMRYLIYNCKDRRVKAPAILYLINKNLFYYIVGFIGRRM